MPAGDMRQINIFFLYDIRV